MGVIDTMKDVAVLIQKLDNIEIVKRVMELQQQVFSLFDENRNLRDKNHALTERLATREQLTFRRNVYWKGEEGPFCSRCWDAESLLVRMHVESGWDPQCPKCDKTAAGNSEGQREVGHVITQDDTDDE